MNTKTIPIWKTRYLEHPRNRAYALDEKAEHDLDILWHACNQDSGVFWFALEELGMYGMNVLRPAPRVKIPRPEPLKDAQGRELPNPWEHGNLVGTPADTVKGWPAHLQRAYREQRTLWKADPELAQDLQARATDQFAYELNRQAYEKEIDDANRVEAEYTSESHAANLFLDPTKTRTEQARFYNALLAESPAKAAVYLREATNPVIVGLWDPIKGGPYPQPVTKTRNYEVILQVHKSSHTKLQKIIERGQAIAKERRKKQFEQEEAERQAAAAMVMKGEAKLRDVMAGVRRLADGRIITGRAA